MNQLSEETIEEIGFKLSKMAEIFPEYEQDDVVKLDKLLLIDDRIDYQVQSKFISGIDTNDQRYLEKLASICLQNNLKNLAEALTEYCLGSKVLTEEVDAYADLPRLLIRLLVHFELTEYLDIERQSRRVKISHEHNYFTIEIGRMPIDDRLGLLKLLHNMTAQAILEAPQSAGVYIEKYNNILSLIRSIEDKEQLLSARWARLLVFDELKYSPKASLKLFQQQTNPFLFDAMLWKNFRILLLPAFGEVRFDQQSILISNEGNGSLKNPSLRVNSEGEILFEISITDTIPAGGTAAFQLSNSQLQLLSTLNPNVRTTVFHLVFDKFDNRRFILNRSVPTSDLLNWLSEAGTSLHEIRSSAELFELVKKFITHIRHRVEQDDGHTSLTEKHNGKRELRSEKEIQVVLKHWFRDLCEQYEVDLNREPLTGRGPLDFKFSIGGKIKCLIEVKLWHSSRLEHGLELQLPTYLIAEDTNYGIYVPIAIDPSQHEEKLNTLIENVKENDIFKNLTIEIMDIRAWKPVSASRTHKVDDITRYQL